MKLKQHPEDFQVEELTDVVPAGQGPFAFYRLAKRGWTTTDALGAIRSRWNLDLGQVSYGGLKDRHAQTVQYLTVFQGPRRGLIHHGVQLEYLGQVHEPYASRHIRANRFHIRLRALEPATLRRAEHAAQEVRVEGVPNYFDDQRFGSVAEGQEFVAHALVQGRFEDALRLALAAPYAYDRAVQKQEKALLRGHWGDWGRCQQLLPRGHARCLVDYLTHHPGDFRGAVARLRPELCGLYLSAYQSYLWNRLLARWLERHCLPEQLVSVRLRLGQVPMYRGLPPEQRATLATLALPLPTARFKLANTDPRAPLLYEVLAEEGLELGQLKVPGIRELFFSKGERAAQCRPEGFTYQSSPEEPPPARHQLLLHFDLPRGCYATLIVKRLLADVKT